MQKSSRFTVASLVLAGMAAPGASGCRSGVAGTYQQICEATCQANADCAGDNPLVDPVDVDDCKRDCRERTPEFEDELRDSCAEGNDVPAVDGAQAEECRDVLGRLGQYCRENDQLGSDFYYLVEEIGTDCNSAEDPVFYCQ